MSLTKQEKIEKLKALGVELTGEEKVKEIDTLLEKFDKRHSEINTMAEIDGADKVKNARQEKNGDRTEIVVRYINPEIGLTDRIFSLADHGENFIEVAEQFAQKFSGTIDPE